MSVAEGLFGGTLALACLAAMASDLRRRVIPNLLCGALLLVGLGFGFYQDGWSGLGWHAAHAGVALAIGMALFAVRWLGGGDGKFYAGCAAWFPLGQGLALGTMISVATLGLVFVWFTWRKINGQPTFTLRSGQKSELPYGVAIGLGALGLYAFQI